MPYILNKTDGSVLTTLYDASIDQTTDLRLVGRNYVGYGEIVNENLIKLLENFSNKTPPKKPITGQLWYDVATKLIKFYDGVRFKDCAVIELSTSKPAGFTNGNFWFDTANEKLYIRNTKHEEGYTPLGPFVTVRKAISTNPTEFKTVLTSAYDIDNIDGTKTNKIFEVVSNSTFNLKNYVPTDQYNNSPLISVFPRQLIREGLNIAPAMSTETVYTYNISSGASTFAGHITGAWKLTAGSTLESTFADLAEKYHADAVYEPGTVLLVGGVNEVTATTIRASTSVAGIVSTAPAYKLNASAGKDGMYPYIALKGRVPCKVLGHVTKGSRLVSSGHYGYAEVMQDGDDPNAVIGIALENFTGYSGMIEVKV